MIGNYFLYSKWLAQGLPFDAPGMREKQNALIITFNIYLILKGS